jgi:cytochrome oxidase Cu insertion factor (SCO1/SenC/PrrC family)
VRARSSATARAVGLIAASVLALAACSPGDTGTSEPTSGPSAAPSGTGETPSDPEALSFTATTLDGAELDVSTLAGKPVVLWFRSRSRR